MCQGYFDIQRCKRRKTSNDQINKTPTSPMTPSPLDTHINIRHHSLFGHTDFNSHDFKMTDFGNKMTGFKKTDLMTDLSHKKTEKQKEHYFKREEKIKTFSLLMSRTPVLSDTPTQKKTEIILNTAGTEDSDRVVIHDMTDCMFKVQLDGKIVAALCYLPTRHRNVIEFIHIELPVEYHNRGIGDLLLYQAFQWVEKANLRVVPTCLFVRDYLEARFPDRKSGSWSCIEDRKAVSIK
ncbi:hypothetical protein BDB01DRAFT_794925 [Pilobolus umbonatus]|nr:hypothetical protein BDB01DRAFT_794925 [Pilobolus umbonatus]